MKNKKKTYFAMAKMKKKYKDKNGKKINYKNKKDI